MLEKSIDYAHATFYGGILVGSLNGLGFEDPGGDLMDSFMPFPLEPGPVCAGEQDWLEQREEERAFNKLVREIEEYENTPEAAAGREEMRRAEGAMRQRSAQLGLDEHGNRLHSHTLTPQEWMLLRPNFAGPRR